MKVRFITIIFVFIVSLIFSSYRPIGFWGCGGGGECNRFTQKGCGDDEVCDLTSDGKTSCFTPVVARGKITNLSDGSAISGARIFALDVNYSPVSGIAISDSSGNYELTVLTTRNSDGLPIGDDFTLRVDAAGFQTFPSGVRTPIPIDTSSPVDEEDLLVIENSLTDVGLIKLEPGAGKGIIYGRVEVPDNSLGTLVVAELSSTSGFSTIADYTGNYKIFNLSAGNYTVKGYSKGVNYTPVIVSVNDGEESADLSFNDEETAILNGSVQIVDPGDGDGTSIILVVESTFNEDIVRGAMPPGLRAPDLNIAPNVKGSFTINGIPSGKYVVLAAFENDFLVRNPDTCISGTDILHQAFASGEDVNLSSGFKITGALNVISPGATEPEVVTTTNPTFIWEDDSSEDNYHLSVFDSFGNMVWETIIPGVGSGNPSVVYNEDGTGAGTATPLESGMYYQFRAVSTRISGGDTCEISQTEDLKGVFYVQ